MNPSVNKLFEDFSKLKVMIIGDVMLDSYIFGKVDRISPEAPVPVVHITSRDHRPGGAANVAVNILSLGAEAVLCSVTGKDDGGARFNKLLESLGLDTRGILQSEHHKTTVKTRVIGNNHQLLRVDDESVQRMDAETEAAFTGNCLRMIGQEKPDVIIFEDYDKGVITENLIRAVCDKASAENIPVTVDPKRRNFNHYTNVTLFKPNLHELVSGLGIIIDNTDLTSLRSAVSGFMQERNMRMVMVTLSEAGVFIASGNEAHLIPAHVRSISDVSGAGDTVISVASLCLAAGLPPVTIAALANLAGGLVCEEVGVVPVNRQRLMEEIEKEPSLISSK